MPVVSDLFASYSNAQGFWIKERSVVTTKKGEEAASHPLSSSLLHVDAARELRSAQYNRDRAKNEARFEQAQKSKRQVRLRRGNATQRNRGAKRSGKRQPIARDLAADSEADYEQDLSDSVFLERREAVLAPVRTTGARPKPAPISPELQPPIEKTPKESTPPDAYATVTPPESALDIPASDIAREFRSYERHRHQTKKSARFTQSRQRKGVSVRPARSRGSKSAKTKNLRGLVISSAIEEGTTSEDEIQTPIEVSLSLVLPDDGNLEVRTPPAIDMGALITTAKVKYAKGSSKSRLSTLLLCTDYGVEPGFEYVKSVRPVVVLDDVHDAPQDEDNETWEHVWNDDLVD